MSVNPPRKLFPLCFWQDYAKKTNQAIFTQFGGNVVHRPRKNPLDVGGNPDAITLGLGLG